MGKTNKEIPEQNKSLSENSSSTSHIMITDMTPDKQTKQINSSKSRLNDSSSEEVVKGLKQTDIGGQVSQDSTAHTDNMTDNRSLKSLQQILDAAEAKLKIELMKKRNEYSTIREEYDIVLKTEQAMTAELKAIKATMRARQAELEQATENRKNTFIKLQKVRALEQVIIENYRRETSSLRETYNMKQMANERKSSNAPTVNLQHESNPLMKEVLRSDTPVEIHDSTRNDECTEWPEEGVRDMLQTKSNAPSVASQASPTNCLALQNLSNTSNISDDATKPEENEQILIAKSNTKSKHVGAKPLQSDKVKLIKPKKKRKSEKNMPECFCQNITS